MSIIKLELANGSYFNFNLNLKKTIYYGANRIGKTQLSIKLEKYFEARRESVLLFDEDILDKMILDDNDNSNKKTIIVMPKIQEIKYYAELKNNYAKKLEVKNEIKKICGTTSKNKFKKLPKIIKYLDENAYSNELLQKYIYEQNIIKEMLSPKEKNILNLFEIIDKLKDFQVDNNFNDLLNLTEEQYYNIQIRIIENNLKQCPICYNKLDDNNIKKIRESVSNGTIDRDLKVSILYYLDLKNELSNIINNIIIDFESIDEISKELFKEVEISIEAHLMKFYNIDDIKNYNHNNKMLKQIYKSIEKFTIKSDTTSKTINFIKQRLKKHSVFQKYDLNIKILNGKLEFDDFPLEFKNLSKSEQNYFKILYFDILVYQKIEEGQLNIIIDDPFDSYDDIYIKDAVKVIIEFLSNNINNINYCKIFSHSTFILNLYRDLINDIKCKSEFKLEWLDESMFDNELKAYEDEYHILSRLDNDVADFGFANSLIYNFSDRNSLIVAASILRNDSKISYSLSNLASNCDVKRVASLFNDFYCFICNNINHIRENCLINDLHHYLNEVYHSSYIEQSGDSTTIQDVFDSIDYKNQNSMKIYYKKSGISSEVCINDVSHLFIFKYLLGLELRRKFEKICIEKLGYSIVYKTVKELVYKLDIDLDKKLIDFYENNVELMNSFNHSSSRTIPPILIYSLKSLQTKYEELIKLKRF